MTSQAEDFVYSGTAVAYVVTASATLLVYDYLCTLDDEIKHIWRTDHPRPLASSLFILNRYLPFIDTFATLNRLTTNMTPGECKRRAGIIIWFTVTGSWLAEVILMMRTYAIWGRKKMIWVFFLFPIVAIISSAAITALEVRSLQYVPLPWPNYVGCYLGSASNIIFVDYALLMISETVILTLTLVKAIPAFRRARSPLITNLYRDGILFYVYLLCMSSANVIVPLVTTADYTNILSTPQRTLHSILCTRVLLVRVNRGSRNAASTTTDAEDVFSSVFPQHAMTIELGPME